MQNQYRIAESGELVPDTELAISDDDGLPGAAMEDENLLSAGVSAQPLQHRNKRKQTFERRNIKYVQYLTFLCFIWTNFLSIYPTFPKFYNVF